jgi:ribosome biogenesis GTPase
MFPGRVVFEGRNMYRVVSEQGENWSIVSGALRNSLAEKRDFPAVGDWVLAYTEHQNEHWIIRQVLPRKSAFTRKIAGQVTEEQVIAANCDFVFTVCSLDGGRNFNLRGLERYLTCAWDSGADPVIILNKADLCEDIDGAFLQAESIAPGIGVHCLSCVTGSGFDSLAPYLEPGRTVALIGRSGVGKSSIINYLSGQEIVKTGELREQDHRGRHTTTHRELVQIPGGGLFLDTPGLRELQLWGEESSLEGSFSDIEALAEGCRFNDCSHTREPGCAVQQALADGSMDYGRFESFLDLQKELRHLKRKQDIRARLQEKNKQKAFSKQHKKHY